MLLQNLLKTETLRRREFPVLDEILGDIEASVLLKRPEISLDVVVGVATAILAIFTEDRVLIRDTATQNVVPRKLAMVLTLPNPDPRTIRASILEFHGKDILLAFVCAWFVFIDAGYG